MNGKNEAARKNADELTAGAVNGQDNEESFDADEEECIEAEVERRLDIKFEMAVEEAVEKEIEERLESDAEQMRFEEAVEKEVEERLERQGEADAERFEEAVEAEVEKRLEHFRESAEFEMAVEEAVEAAIGKSGVKGDTNANLATSLRDAVNAAKREAEEFGVAWDRTNTEPAAKTFRVELALDVSARLKLGILAARCNVTPERWLCDFLHGKFADFCASVFDKRHGNPMCDDALAQCAYEALLPTALTAIVGGASGGARLVFRPAVMA